METIRPKFSRPPLIEQAITVIFEDLPNLTLGDFGLFWAEIRDEFPVCESQPLVQQTIEQFDEFVARGLTFQILPQEVLPRCFYRSNDRGELVQLQRDRFSFNWMKSDNAEYPHFEATTARFKGLFDRFLSFVKSRTLGEVRIKQCEITNVNIVPISELGGEFSGVGKAFSVPNFERQVEFLEFESYISNVQCRILNNDKKPIGRLHMSLAPVQRVGDHEFSYRFELTARGAPMPETVEGVFNFFNIGRNAINSAFLSATTAWAHSLWGKIDGNGTTNG